MQPFSGLGVKNRLNSVSDTGCTAIIGSFLSCNALMTLS